MHLMTKRTALVEREPEARHPRIGDGHSPGLALLEEQRDHAAAAADDVAVAHATERSRVRGTIGVAMDEELFGAKLGGAI